jgi:hypothetical protein
MDEKGITVKFLEGTEVFFFTFFSSKVYRMDPQLT